MYRILDRQNPGRLFADGAYFHSLNQVRSQLCSYHEIDWTGVNDDDTPKDIDTLTLAEILDYGEWTIIDENDHEI